MTLTHPPGPLSGTPAATNYAIEGPKHRLLLTPLPRRVRGELGGEVVIDTEGAYLLHETGLPPRLYVPLADVRADALLRTETTTHCPFKGDASYRTLSVGDGVAQDALWVYDEPLPQASWLDGLAGVYLERLDRWYDEDEEVQGFPDPYHRVDIRRTTRRVEVRVHGDLVASTDRALLLSETGLPNRFYLPRDAVTTPLHGPTDTSSYCPYKGTASYWTLALPDGTLVPDAAWSYEDPLPESTPITGYVSFWGDDVEISATS
jgi:uncharacterized protein (DUF427 family)